MHNYSHAFKRIVRRLLLIAQVHRLIQCIFYLRGVELDMVFRGSAMQAWSADILRKNGKKILQEIDALFRKNDIVYWVDAGTLLGIMRDGDFIKDDTDIDIAVLCHNSEHVYRLLKQYNFISRYYFTNISNSKILLRVEKYGIGMDVELFEVARETRLLFYNEPCHFLGDVENKWILKQYRFFSHVPCDVMRQSFGAIEVNIPRKWEQYLEVYYGKNWRIPMKRGEYTGLEEAHDELQDSYAYQCYESRSIFNRGKGKPFKLKLEILYCWLMQK